jgi:signal transduction histidine kinase
MTDNETKRSLMQYQLIIELSLDLASTLELDQLLRRVVGVAIELIEAETASILLYDESRKELHFRASTDSKNEASMSGIIVPAESLAGWVAVNRQPIIVNNVKKDKRYFKDVEDMLDYPIRSLIAVPLIAKDKLVGVLEVLNRKKGRFGLHEEETLQVLGAQAAIAIQNAQLFQQSDLIAELVHELRTPLTSICTISYLLQRDELPQNQRTSLAKTIYQESTRLNDMASSFLDLARLESGRSSYYLSTFSIVQLIKECIQIVHVRAEEAGVNVAVDVRPGQLELTADRDKMKQVLLNLLYNAIKYNKPGGSVTLRAAVEQEKMVITIKDTGIGIAPEDLEHMFEKFYRTSRTETTSTGTGLGLFICDRIIRGHKGQITVESKVDIGSTFTITMPLNLKDLR